MAKRKEEAGPGTFMILVLVFFILASLILGVTTYLGFNGQAELEGQAKAAKDEQKKAADNAAEQTLRRNVCRAALGTETPENRQELAGTPQPMVPHVLDEIKSIKEKVGAAGALPGPKGVFDIPVAGGAEGGAPAVAPTKNLPQIAKEWYKIAEDYKSRAEDAEKKKKNAETSAQATQAQREKDEEAFKAAVKNLNDAMAAKIKNMDEA